jgi:uncharacterized repeat protein (TIGR01451 family)
MTIFKKFILFSTVLIVGFFTFASLACEPPVTPTCKLELVKTDNQDPISPGSELTYTLTLKNTGTADCSGTGVRIKDVFDLRMTYVSSSITPEEKTSDYIKWNLGTLHPGDSKIIDVTMLVSESTNCTSTLINKAKYWSTQTDWGNFVTEETSVTCPQKCIAEGGSGAVVPSGPSCCEGLTQIGCSTPISGGCSECVGSFYCTQCGNNICGLGENECNCPQDCKKEPACKDIIVVSDTNNIVVETSENASLAWVHNLWTSITGSSWIWKSQYIENPTQNETYNFSKDFNVVGTISSATLTLATDNSYKVWLNNVLLGENAGEHNYEATVSYDVTNKIINGTNTIRFEVTNLGLPNSTPQSNPAGLLYKLKIERSSCEPTSVSIHGVVFKDLNGNKFQDASEAGIPNVLVTLDGTATGTTDANGSYGFLSATSGIHTIVETDNPGYYSTTPNTVSTSTILGQSYEINFGDAISPYCGDGAVNQTSEQCDDGNTANGDGCSATCQTESYPPICINCGPSSYCGDGVKNGSEQCDGKSGVTEGYTCTPSCTLNKKTCSTDLNAMIVMDVSGSMGYENPNRLSMAKIAANNFLGYLRANDKSGVVSFSSSVSLKKALSNNHEASKAIVNSFTSFGSTDIGDAIDTANKELISAGTNADSAKIEIILTDGRANKPTGNGFSENPADVALVVSKSLEAANKGITIFTIGLGGDVNSNMLRNVAENTKGKYYFSPSAKDLNDIFNQIAFEVCKLGTTTATSAAPAISIFNARALLVSGNNVTISWYTNIPATSRVVYGNDRVVTPGNEPNYGYAFSTPEQDSVNKVIFHSVTIADLVPGTTYFWRPISHGSPVTVGQESSFTTSVENPKNNTSTTNATNSQPVCKQEGESVPVIETPPACCSGLDLIPPKEEATLGSMGICTGKCGDGTCDSKVESSYNCSKDCKETNVVASENEKNNTQGSNLANLLAAVGTFANTRWWILLIPLMIFAVLYWAFLRRKTKKI